jgi:hypothetical protein
MFFGAHSPIYRGFSAASLSPEGSLFYEFNSFVGIGTVDSNPWNASLLISVVHFPAAVSNQSTTH